MIWDFRILKEQEIIFDQKTQTQGFVLKKTENSVVVWWKELQALEVLKFKDAESISEEISFNINNQKDKVVKR